MSLENKNEDETITENIERNCTDDVVQEVNDPNQVKEVKELKEVNKINEVNQVNQVNEVDEVKEIKEIKEEVKEVVKVEKVEEVGEGNIETENFFNVGESSQLENKIADNSNSDRKSRYGKQIKNASHSEIYVPKTRRSSKSSDSSKSLPDEKIENVDNVFENQEILNEYKEKIEPIEPVKVENELKNECTWNVGDLTWAQVNSFPYWPSIVTLDNETQTYTKGQSWGRGWTNMVHVTYFGDNIRHNWIRERSLMPFTSHEDFMKMVDDWHRLPEKVKKKDPKQTAGFTIKPFIQKKWLIAVKEAEDLIPLDTKSRLEFIKPKKRKRKSTSSRDLDDNNYSSPKKIKLNGSIKKKRVRKSDVDNSLGKHFLLNDDVPPTPPSSHRDSSDESVVNKKMKVTKLITHHSPKPSFSLYYSKTRDDVSKVAPDSTEEDIILFLKKSWKNMREEARKQFIPKVEQYPNKQPSIDRETNSSEDSTDLKRPRRRSKINTQAILENAMKIQPQNLFRGYKSERVCQICEEPSNLIRCKGPCFSYFHLSCVNPGEDEEDSSCDNKIIIRKRKKKNKLSINMKDAEESDKEILLITIGDEDEKKVDDKTLTSMENEEKKSNEILNGDDDNDNKIDDNDNYNDHDNYNDDEKKKIIESVNSPDYDEIEEKKDTVAEEFKCIDCLSGVDPACFVCHKREDDRLRCTGSTCGKYYHPRCLKYWPQSSLIGDRLTCPYHMCHTCVSDYPQQKGMLLISKEKLVRCVRCPSTYHNTPQCLPAGTDILTGSQIICPKHYKPTHPPVNVTWCFLCSRGGSLICCDTCPTSFHLECLGISAPEGAFICEDCETGRLPLYGEVVWVKLGNYRWWPSKICYPYEVPDNIDAVPHNKRGEFCVLFLGSLNFHWIHRGRVFLYQDEDSSIKAAMKKHSKIDDTFAAALKQAHDLHKIFKLNKIQENRILKPPPYVKLKTNKPVGNLKPFEKDVTSACECHADWENACAPETDCLNRILLIECDPQTCRAGERCNNQSFAKRLYPNMEPFYTNGRGWGLKALERIKSGQFVIEYVGEVIDETEYKNRVQRKKELRNENYYFLTIDMNRTIDAEPKGNLSRFMNHSCQPNCETQKWTVFGDIRIGLFAVRDIEVGEELTFNYRLAPDGEKKKPCLCGAPNCSGFIGLKAQKLQIAPGSQLKYNGVKRKSGRKRKTISPTQGKCWKCEEFISDENDINECSLKSCKKKYHKKCCNFVKRMCPWHSCDICRKRTSFHCTLCSVAYCQEHIDNKLSLYGDTNNKYVCNNHENPTEDNSTKSSLETLETLETLAESNIKDESDNSLESLLADSDSPVVQFLANGIFEVQMLSDGGEEFQIKGDNNTNLNVINKSKLLIQQNANDKLAYSKYNDDDISDLPSLTTSQVRQIIGSEVVS